MFSINENILYGRILHDIHEKYNGTQTEKTAKNILFTKTKVIVKEKW